MQQTLPALGEEIDKHLYNDCALKHEGWALATDTFCTKKLHKSRDPYSIHPGFEHVFQLLECDGEISSAR